MELIVGTLKSFTRKLRPAPTPPSIPVHITVSSIQNEIELSLKYPYV